MFPATPIWSTGHPPHTATEPCSSLPPSPRTSSDLQLWPPCEVISSRYYSVVPFVLKASRSDFINFTMSSPLRISSSSRLDLILHRSPSFTGS
jgi:hypothetical protein